MKELEAKRSRALQLEQERAGYGTLPSGKEAAAESFRIAPPPEQEAQPVMAHAQRQARRRPTNLGSR